MDRELQKRVKRLRSSPPLEADERRLDESFSSRAFTLLDRKERGSSVLLLGATSFSTARDFINGLLKIIPTVLPLEKTLERAVAMSFLKTPNQTMQLIRSPSGMLEWVLVPHQRWSQPEHILKLVELSRESGIPLEFLYSSERDGLTEFHRHQVNVKSRVSKNNSVYFLGAKERGVRQFNLAKVQWATLRGFKAEQVSAERYVRFEVQEHHPLFNTGRDEFPRVKVQATLGKVTSTLLLEKYLSHT